MKELIIKAKNGCHEAQTIMIEENKGLIHKAMKRYFNTSFNEDLLSIGYGEILSAIKDYDLDRGIEFSTLAYTYICTKFRRELEKMEWNTHKANYDAVLLSAPVRGKGDSTTEDTVGDLLAATDGGLSDFEYLFQDGLSIWEAVKTLSEEEQIIFEAKYVRMLPRKEVAKIIGLKNVTGLQRREQKLKWNLATAMNYNYDPSKMDKKSGGRYK